MMNLKASMTTEECNGTVPINSEAQNVNHETVNETMPPTSPSPMNECPPNLCQVPSEGKEDTAAPSVPIPVKDASTTGRDGNPRGNGAPTDAPLPSDISASNDVTECVSDNVSVPSTLPGDVTQPMVSVVTEKTIENVDANGSVNESVSTSEKSTKDETVIPPTSKLHRGISLLEMSPKKSSLKRKNVETEDASKPKKRKTITFNEINVYYFPRAQGFTCVPSQGGSTLGMASHHTHVERFSLSEHAAEQKRARRDLLIQQRQQRQLMRMQQQQGCQKAGSGSSSEDSQTDEDDGSDFSDSEIDLDNYYFLQVGWQPVPTRQRRAMLRASGIRKIESVEKDECRSIRSSREFCGCQCKIYCDPDTCSCAQAGIKCQVDRLNFPCGCTRDGCKNSNGRIEFNPLRVRTHFIHTLMRLELERKRDQSGWRDVAPESDQSGNWLNMGLGATNGLQATGVLHNVNNPMSLHQYGQHGTYFSGNEEFLKNKTDRPHTPQTNTHAPPVDTLGSCLHSAGNYRSGHYDNPLPPTGVSRGTTSQDPPIDLYGTFQEDSFSDNSEEFSNDSYDSQVQNHFSENAPAGSQPHYNSFDLANFQLHSHYTHGFGASNCPSYNQVSQPYQQLNTDVKYPPMRNYPVNPNFNSSTSCSYPHSYDLSTNFSNQFQHETGAFKPGDPGQPMNGFVGVDNGSAISSCDGATLTIPADNSITTFTNSMGPGQSYTNLNTVSSLSKISTYTDLLPVNSSFSCLQASDSAAYVRTECNGIHDEANNGNVPSRVEASHLLDESISQDKELTNIGTSVSDTQEVEPSENFGEIIKKTMVETVSA